MNRKVVSQIIWLLFAGIYLIFLTVVGMIYYFYDHFNFTNAFSIFFNVLVFFVIIIYGMCLLLSTFSITESNEDGILAKLIKKLQK